MTNEEMALHFLMVFSKVILIASYMLIGGVFGFVAGLILGGKE